MIMKTIYLIIAFNFLISPCFAESQELSLKQDREELEQLRKDIPEDIKKENDDWAFTLNLFTDKKRSSGKIQSQFDRTYNKARKKKQQEFKKRHVEPMLGNRSCT